MIRTDRLAIVVIALALGACSGSQDGEFGRAAPEVDADDGAPDNGNGDQHVDEGVIYWSLKGNLEIAEGELLLDASWLTLSAHDQTGATADDDEVCELRIQGATDGPARDDSEAMLVAWWSIELVDDDAETPCPWALPQPDALIDGPSGAFVLGIGDLSPALYGPMAAAGLGSDLPVYGLRTLLPSSRGDREVSFGVTGTSANFAGVGGRVLEPPLPDGSYQVQTLVLLPL